MSPLDEVLNGALIVFVDDRLDTIENDAAILERHGAEIKTCKYLTDAFNSMPHSESEQKTGFVIDLFIPGNVPIELVNPHWKVKEMNRGQLLGCYFEMKKFPNINFFYYTAFPTKFDEGLDDGKTNEDVLEKGRDPLGEIPDIFAKKFGWL